MRSLAVVLCFLTLAGASASPADDIEVRIAPLRINLGKYGQLTMSGNVALQKLMLKDRAIVAEARFQSKFDRQGLEQAVITFVNKNILPKVFNEIKVLRIISISVQDKKDSILVESEVYTTGLVDGQQKISFEIGKSVMRGLSTDASIQIIPGSTHLICSGSYNWFRLPIVDYQVTAPASWGNYLAIVPQKEKEIELFMAESLKKQASNGYLASQLPSYLRAKDIAYVGINITRLIFFH